ncbi:MAG: thiamine phosphate synthase, partial [Lentisphaeria bacterium]|nr:thiamine phosphate synthase [Lentisphaeria bacterium]
AEIVSNVTIPVVAIGGIKTANLASVVETGVSNIAIISEIIMSDAIPKTIEKITGLLK